MKIEQWTVEMPAKCEKSDFSVCSSKTKVRDLTGEHKDFNTCVGSDARLL